jgi:hypothetical protein
MNTDIHAAAASRNNFTSFIFACINQVDADPETSAQELRLAWVISQMINKKTRVCFPLQSTLAKRLGVSDRAVREYIAGLVDRGHLRVRHRGRDKSSIYELILQDRNAASGRDTGRPEDTFRSSAVDRNEDRKSDVARPEVSRCKTGTVLPTEPISEPISEPEERGAPSARPRSSLSGEEIPTSPPPTATEPMLARARERAGWDTVKSKDEFEKFRNLALSKGTQSHNWDAAFSVWIERGVEHQAKRKGQTGKIIDQDGNDLRPPPQAKPRPRKQSNTDRARGMLQ